MSEKSATVNVELLETLAGLYRERGDGKVMVESGKAQRTIFVEKGRFIAAQSNIAGDRVGDLLVADGTLDKELLDAAEQIAKQKGRYLGDQLVADGVISPMELAALVERQCLVRFRRALLMFGGVTQEKTGPTRPALGQSLGVVVIDAFRKRLPFVSLQQIIASLPMGPLQLRTKLNVLAELELAPSEIAVCKKIDGKQTVSDLTAAVQDDQKAWEAMLRFLAGLSALQLVA